MEAYRQRLIPASARRGRGGLIADASRGRRGSMSALAYLQIINGTVPSVFPFARYYLPRAGGLGRGGEDGGGGGFFVLARPYISSGLPRAIY
jgi:hypothetical protein